MRCRCRKNWWPRPFAQVGPGDEAGDFRQDQGLAVSFRAHDAQLGGQGGEGKGADPGLGGGEGLEQGGFTGIGGAHQAHVRQDLEFQVNAAFPARFAGLAEAGGAHPGGGEVGVALAAPAPFGQDQAFPGGHEVGQEPAGVAVKDAGAQGHRDDHRGAVFAVAILALAPAAVFRLEDAPAPEVTQGAEGRGDFEADIAAGAAITAVGSAPGLEAGPEEADTARAAVAGPDRDIDFIGKGFQVGG